MSVIDLRSDTVTRPTAAMKRAMFEAQLGDDVYGEDPTVNELERLAAEQLGKEASLFVPSGTMGNLIALLVHAPRGSEVLLGDESHIYHYEQGGACSVGGLVFHPVATQKDGTLRASDLHAAVRDPDDDHSARAGVICLENTHNRRGGTVLPADYSDEIGDLARSLRLPLHLDGARLANASVAAGLPMARLAAPFDSVQLDLSKGLGAPVGGVVAGTARFVKEARRYRKLLGGGMRQAGVLAAAGVFALRTMVQRLAEDHARAVRLAQGLAAIPGVQVADVHTNLVLFTTAPHSPEEFIDQMRAQGVLLGSIGGKNLRFVTHFDVSDADVEAAIAAARTVVMAGITGRH
jgi:threonine aldolase